MCLQSALLVMQWEALPGEACADGSEGGGRAGLSAELELGWELNPHLLGDQTGE